MLGAPPPPFLALLLTAEQNNCPGQQVLSANINRVRESFHIAEIWYAVDASGDSLDQGSCWPILISATAGIPEGTS